MTPFCRVSCLAFQADERSNASRIDRALFRLWSTAGGGGINGPGLTTAAGYDTHGINQVTGALRASSNGSGQSQGRDVDELIGRFVEQIGGLNFVACTHGFQGRYTRTEKMETVDGVQVLKRALEVEVLDATESKTYAALVGFTATQTGAGSPAITLTWPVPPARFDSLPVAAPRLIIRRGATSGASAPTNPTSGGVLVSSSVLASAGTLANNPGSYGTWNYAAWVLYGETPAAQLADTPDNYSASATASVTTSP